MRCARCGAENAAGARFCVKCGASAEMMRGGGRVCPSCGATLDVKRKFCLKCGANVEAVWAAQPVTTAQQPQARPQPEPEIPAGVCPKCGANIGSAKFCPHCGAAAAASVAKSVMNFFEQTSRASAAAGETRMSMEGAMQLTAIINAGAGGMGS